MELFDLINHLKDLDAGYNDEYSIDEDTLEDIIEYLEQLEGMA